MVDKVTAANKKIAATAARGPAGAGIFELPTFAKSMTPTMLFDLAKDKGFITQAEQADFTRRVGKDPTALAEFNKKVPSNLKYQGIQPELKGVFASQGATPMTSQNKNLRVNTSKIAKETFDEVNAMDAPRETKIQKFVDDFMSKVKNVSPQAALNLARRFVMMFFGGPSTIGADMMSEQANQEAMSKIFGQPMNFAGGGMMNMDEMTRPLGYDVGGIVPKEKPVNFKAIMAEFDTPENKAGPGEPTGIEKIIADEFPVDPRFTMKQRIKEMLGMVKDQGSGLMDDAMDIETLGMILELQGVLSFDEIDKMKNMSPIQIKILYDKTFSGEN